VVYQTMVKYVRTLMPTHLRLGVDTEMQTIKVVDPLAQALVHGNQKSFQLIGLGAALYFGNPRILDGEANRFCKVR
jgi:hypothetical protein